MKLRACNFLLVLLLSSLAFASAAPGHFVFDEPAELTFACDGQMGQFARNITQNWLLVAPQRNPAMLQMFAERDTGPYRDLLPWSGEFAGKYLTGATDILRLTGDNALRQSLQGFVDHFVALQDADGYLGPFPRQARLMRDAPNCKGTWDAWGHYHAMLGLLDWYTLTHDEKALHAASRIGDLLCTHFLGNGHHILDMGSPDQNQAIAHGLCLLYEQTHAKRYLDLAQQIVTEFEAPGAGDYVRTALAGTEFFATPKPRWESLHAIEALPLLYRITGDERYARAFQHIWWSIDKLDRHNNGGFSSGEQAVGNPYSRAPIETCCTVAWMAMSVDMLRLSGDSIVADELELSTLNQAYALESPDGSWCTYNTPMDGVRIPSIIDIAFQKRPGAEELSCCSVNAARAFGLLSHWGLLATRDAHGMSGLVLNWYGPSVMSAKIGDVPVSLSQKTSYPRDGHVELTIDAAAPTKFALMLRIPNWSTQTHVRVNDDEIASVRAGAYDRIVRNWKKGDRVIIDLDFSLHAWVGERESSGKAALYRGPILLAREIREPEAPQCSADWSRSGALWISQTPSSSAEATFRGDSIRWIGKRFDDAGLTRVEIDGKQVAEVDQYGPRRDDPFEWSYSGCGPGEHKIRLILTGNKNSASIGKWSNIVSLRDAEHSDRSPGPPIDLQHVTCRLLPDTPAGHLLQVELTNHDAPALMLTDYASAGTHGRSYLTWLSCAPSQAAAFDEHNPLRLSRAGDSGR